MPAGSRPIWSGDNVIDLMAALKQSLEGKKAPAPSKPASDRRKPAAKKPVRKAPAKKTAAKRKAG